jgi:acyl carrier protein
VVVRQDGAQGARLVAHLVPAGDRRPSEAEIREVLRRDLPHYMVPAAVHWHDSLPLTGNGKVDRSRLTAAGAPAARVNPAASGAVPDPGLERDVAALWARVLKLSDVDATSNLYDLGGDSLAAARILTDVRRQFGISIRLDQLPEVETVRAMAAHIGVARAGQVTA